MSEGRTDGGGSASPGRARAHPRARMLWTAAVLFAAVVAFGIWLRAAGADPLPVDRWWHDLAGVAPDSPAFGLARALAVAGSGIGAASCTAAAVLALLGFRRIRDAGAVATAMLLGILASETLKLLVARPRPWDALLDPPGFSYPSGHSMGAAALAVSLALIAAAAPASPSAPVRPARRRVAWAIAAAWILLMMWSRTAVQVHWLSDTIAGAALGIAAALTARALWLRLRAPLEPAAAP